MHWAGVLLAGALARIVRDGAGFFKANWRERRPSRNGAAKRLGGGVQEAGQGVDEAAGLVEVFVWSGRSSARRRLTAAALIRCRAAAEMISTLGTSAMSRETVDTGSGCEVAPGSVMLLLLLGDRPGLLVTPERNTRGYPVVQV